MSFRIAKIVLGVLLIFSARTEYYSYIKQMGHMKYGILAVVVLLSVFGLSLIYSGIKDKNLMDIIKRKK